MQYLRPYQQKKSNLRRFVPVLIIVTIGVMAIGGVALAMKKIKNSAGYSMNTLNVLTATIPEPVPPPTEINKNFIDQVNYCFLPTAAAFGYDLRITSAFRSMEEQQELYELGRTEDGAIITNAAPGMSLHNYGYAVDVADRLRAYDIDWEKIGRIGAYCGLEQGVEGDLPHFEYRAGLFLKQFELGMRPKELRVPCELMVQRAQADEPLTKQDLQLCGVSGF